jgi:hypothetical protein
MVRPCVARGFLDLADVVLHQWNADRGVGLAQELPPKDGSGDEDGGADFHGQQCKNDTHASTSDPDSRLYRKAAGEAKLCYMGNATMENQHGLAVAGMVTHANGTAERHASERMLKAKTASIRLSTSIPLEPFAAGITAADAIGDPNRVESRIPERSKVDGHRLGVAEQKGMAQIETACSRTPNSWDMELPRLPPTSAGYILPT